MEQMLTWAQRVLSEKVKRTFERWMIAFALVGFFVHLFLIFLNSQGWLPYAGLMDAELLSQPLAAVYTPFSVILVFEVYLLVYYLPKSFTTSIAKQYEIIALIIIRGIFKDIEKIHLDLHWFQYQDNVQLSVDMVAFLLLFFLIAQFYIVLRNTPKVNPVGWAEGFVRLKYRLGLVLVVVLIGLAFYSLGKWFYEFYRFTQGTIDHVISVNEVFYHDFFIVLILVDVFLLIVSFRHVENFSQLVRNSGFIISTVFIRLSFLGEGMINTLLTVVGVVFGLVTLLIYRYMINRLQQAPHPSREQKDPAAE
ncbi:MAG TPA: hypothetical protein DCE41_17845 [Cytophagales bacterium]|nr:hypothetical protein [Cytophagales bacterium]HAP58284.1 hypothetical protein [Cytophagales bacterium]